MATGVRTKYSAAINGKGYILKGTPQSPAYSRSVVATEIGRLAISDVAYSDFSGSGLFYLAQTDWSAGFKAEKTWVDDAKFYYSTNIDAYSEPGVIKLEKELVTNNDFTEALICGGSLSAGGTVSEYVGTGDDGSGYPQVYKFGGVSWAAITTTTFGTAKNVVSQLIEHKNKVYALNVGTGNTYTVGRYDGSSWSDLTADILSDTSISNLSAARCGATIGNEIFIGCDAFADDLTYIISSADGGTTWVKEVQLSTDGVIVACANFSSKFYYLLVQQGVAYLRVFDPTTSIDTDVPGGIFYGHSMSSFSGLSNLMRVFASKLIITIPDTRIYEYDGNTLSLIFKRDDNKNTIGKEASVDLGIGAIEQNSVLIWGNLIYDGEAWFNHKKANGDSTSVYLRPLYTTSDDLPRYISVADTSILLNNDTTYKSTLSANFMILSEMSPVSKIDKLLYSFTLLFDSMASGQQIQIQYSINNMSSWTTLDTLTPTTEGTNTKKEIFVPSNVIFNKIWVKVLLDGAATTPKVLDVIMAYKPMPDYKNRWNLQLEMNDKFSLLNGQTEQRNSLDLLNELWTEKINKRKVAYEDVDYCECTLVSAMTSAATSAWVNATRLFPRQGRMRIVSGSVAEEITYTSAETNKLKGITRAVRGTRARAYLVGQVVKNDFDVYVDSISERLNFTDERNTEGLVQVSLVEA